MMIMIIIICGQGMTIFLFTKLISFLPYVSTCTCKVIITVKAIKGQSSYRIPDSFCINLSVLESLGWASLSYPNSPNTVLELSLCRWGGSHQGIMMNTKCNYIFPVEFINEIKFNFGCSMPMCDKKIVYNITCLNYQSLIVYTVRYKLQILNQLRWLVL